MTNHADNVLRLPKSSQNTRKNFGTAASRKRGESNFMRAFERAWFARHVSGLAAGEFALSGYGVADLVWLAWRPNPDEEDFSAMSIQQQIARRHLYAFEAKLKDWQRALQQAIRYRYFADKSIVVMPFENADAALANLDAFRHSSVGFWTFECDVRRRFYCGRLWRGSRGVKAEMLRCCKTEMGARLKTSRRKTQEKSRMRIAGGP